MEWDTVFDIRNEAEMVRHIQRATLETEDYGFLPEPALFGSPEWWAAVADGRVSTHTREGIVADVRWESMGDWPAWTFRDHDGRESRWTREGDPTRYVDGLAARITCAVVSWKPTSQFVIHGEPAIHDQLIRVDLERSERRNNLPGRTWSA